MFIVVWAETVSGPDRWVVFGNELDARERYLRCIEAGFYTASICSVVESTDYDHAEKSTSAYGWDSEEWETRAGGAP